MQRSIPLGRIAGIQIGANWSWLIIFALVAWSLAEGIFPNQNPGLTDTAYWVMGAIAALLFFGSILLHELGHALQARRDDVEIQGITLWLFGGVAQFRSLYGSPGSEFRIATAAFGALWLAFIGWFLSGAAHAEAQDVAVRRALGGLRVSDVMSREPVSVPPEVTLQAFVDEYAIDSTFTSYPVVEQDRLLGLLTFEAVTSVSRDEWRARKVGDVMVPRDRVALLDADHNAADAVQELAGADVDRALVVKDDHLVGLVAPADLARAVELAGTDRQAG